MRSMILILEVQYCYKCARCNPNSYLTSIINSMMSWIRIVYAPGKNSCESESLITLSTNYFSTCFVMRWMNTVCGEPNKNYQATRLTQYYTYANNYKPIWCFLLKINDENDKLILLYIQQQHESLLNEEWDENNYTMLNVSGIKMWLFGIPDSSTLSSVHRQPSKEIQRHCRTPTTTNKRARIMKQRTNNKSTK